MSKGLLSSVFGPENEGMPTISRRGFGTLAVLSSLTALPGAAGAVRLSPSWLAIFDRRCIDPAVAKSAFLGLSAEVLDFAGDVTSIWQNHLRGFWTANRGVVVGVTRGDALFCIDMLARDQDHRLVYEQEVQNLGEVRIPPVHTLKPIETATVPHPDDTTLRFWVVGPVRFSK